MGLSRDKYIRIKQEYSTKYMRARELADARRAELYEKVEGVKEIDSLLSATCLDIMTAVTGEKGDAEERLASVKSRNRKLQARRAELLAAAGYPTDYSDIKYECEKCSDSGYLDDRMCDCMRRALIRAGFESSGLGALIEKQSFDNFSLEYYSSGGELELVSYALEALKRFASDFSRKSYTNFLLLGGTGLGKTHLSTSVARAVIEKGYDVHYVSALGLIGDFENKRFGNSATAGTPGDVSVYYETDLLIIDDLGTEMVNQFTVSCLYDVINSRINNQKSTIINTNLNNKEIEARYSERITSRLFGEYMPLVFRGNDIRKQKLMRS